MMDINTLVDNIILSHAAAEDNDRARRSAEVNKDMDTIVPFLIFAALAAIVIFAALAAIAIIVAII